MPPKSKSPVEPKAKASVKAKSSAKAKVPAQAESPAKMKKLSKTKASVDISNVESPIILKDFPIFSNLPAELQLHIWKHSHSSRIITLKPSKFSFPPLLHACTDSRRECILAGYQIWIRDMKTGLVYSPWRDILLLDKTSFSDSLRYHVNSIHTMRCKQVNLKMLEPIEKLAFSLQEVMEVWRTQCFHCFLSTKLKEFFPNLKELIVILRPGPSGATHDDLYDVTESATPHLKWGIADVKRMFKQARDDGACKDIVLRLMRLEHWST